MLVVVHNRNIESFLKALFNVETFWCLDVFEIYTAKCRCYFFYCLAEFLWVFLGNLNIENINATINLEKQTFSFHNRFATHSTNVAKTKNGSTITNNSNKISFICIFIYLIRSVLNFQAWICNTR